MVKFISEALAVGRKKRLDTFYCRVTYDIIQEKARADFFLFSINPYSVWFTTVTVQTSSNHFAALIRFLEHCKRFCPPPYC